MYRRAISTLILALMLAACQPAAPLNPAPTVVPFPTVTPGRLVRGSLATVVALPLDGSGLANPATAVALANQPTPAPNYGVCPAPGSPTLPPVPGDGQQMAREMVQFLANGGTATGLESGLRAWGVLENGGLVRGDVDFTGEGVPEVLAAFASPSGEGTVLIAGCVGGLYASLFETVIGDETPQIVQVGDMNFDGRADVLFSAFDCSPVNPEDCAYRTDLRTFNAAEGRFGSLLNGALTSSMPPTTSDVDNDQVAEVVVRLDDTGNETTGPLRTGVNIYDWNGAAYVLSIVQLDPPRFQIQIVHEADRALARLETEQAIALYELALTDSSLRFWFNDEPNTLKSYIYYRLILAYAYTEADDLLATYQASLQAFPDPTTAPVYVAMIGTFWNAFQVTHNLHSACLEVLAIIGTRPEALALLNRYGSRSPTYTAEDVCPF